VKLKQQQSDLKFVFSVKLKDGTTAEAAVMAPAGRSLLKKNATKMLASSFDATSRSQLHSHHLQSSTLGRHTSDALSRRPANKKHRPGLTNGGSGGGGEYTETVCAVRSLIQAEAAALGKFIPDFKNRKEQIDREIHNSMERQRRIELKREFDSLKSLIPEVATNEKVSKLTLLNVAARYVARLETTQSKLRWRKDLLKEKKKQLMQRLNFLHISA
jgi:Helix-loop-helix DNA-binding domain